MFCRVEVEFDKPIYMINGGLKTFTSVDDEGNIKGITYNKIWSPDMNNFYKIIPEKYRDDFCLSIMNINCAVPPHTDTEILVTINFYVETSGARTVFYESIVDKPRTTQIENQTDGYLYFEEDLKETGSFIAKDYEVWVLDVKKIHSVIGNLKTRKAVTLSTNTHSYEDVIAMIKESGYALYEN